MDQELVPGSSWLPAGAGLVAGLIGLVRWAAGRRVSRVQSLEELVDLLRRELDKSLVRGNATLTMARILLFAVDQEPEPSAAMIAARDHAREVIAEAAKQLGKR